MSDIDKAIARAYLELAADLALRAANIASACDGEDARKMEASGDKVVFLLKSFAKH